ERASTQHTRKCSLFNQPGFMIVNTRTIERSARGDLSARGKDAEHFAQPLLNFAQVGSVCPRVCERQSSLGTVPLRVRLDELARALDGVTLFVEKLLHANDIFHVFATVNALTRITLTRFELRELRLPETQHIRRQCTQLGDLADAKE